MLQTRPVSMNARDAAAFAGVSVRQFYRLIAPLVRQSRLTPGSDALYIVADIEALVLARVVYVPENTTPAVSGKGSRRAPGGESGQSRGALPAMVADRGNASQGG